MSVGGKGRREGEMDIDKGKTGKKEGMKGHHQLILLHIVFVVKLWKLYLKVVT